MSQVSSEARQAWKVTRPHLKQSAEYFGRDWLVYAVDHPGYDFRWFKTWAEAYAYAYVCAYGTPEARRHMENFISDGNRLSATYVRRLGVGNV